LKQNFDFNHQKKNTYYISKIFYDNETIIDYARELSYDLSFFEYKNNIHRYLPNINSDSSIIKKTFTYYKNRKRQSGSIGEWIVDNYYLIEKQIKCLKLDFKSIEKSKLPVLTRHQYNKLPRVFALADEFIGHRQGIFTDDVFLQFINSFQKRETLNMKEVSVFPIFLKAALIHHLANIVKLDSEFVSMNSAAKMAFNLFKKDDNFKDFLVYIYDKKNNAIIENGIFLETLNKLISNSKKEENGYKYFLKCMKRKAINLEAQISFAQTERAKNQIYIANIISSIRSLSNTPWDEFVLKSSVVERQLCSDPNYKNMDFESKFYYKKEVESLSFRFNVPEISIVNKAVELSLAHNKHIGFFLFRSEKSLLYSEFSTKKSHAFVQKFKPQKYVASIIIPTLFFSFLIAMIITKLNYGLWLATIVFITSIVPFFIVVSSFVNKLLERIFDIIFIPRLNHYEVNKSPDYTMVITPCLITHTKNIDELVNTMQVNYLSNKLSNIKFAIVADFKSSAKEITDDEQIMIDYANAKINQINLAYGDTIFYFYARRKVFDGNTFACWERKRGAVVDFCHMIKNNNPELFYTNKTNIPDNISYIITIDADTKMTLDSAEKLIGAMIHPLNTPILSKDRRRVIDGYGLITPNIGVDIEDAAKSKFSFIFANNAGIDSYSSSRSNIYQDVFGTSIFSGKGIFHLDSFVKILSDSFEDNRVLSHDFLEGHYLRTGYASDVVFVDGFPSGYIPWCERLHRWVRGDWQHIPWLRSVVKNRSKREYTNPLGLLAKFQIISNLLKSLMPISILTIIFLSVTIFAKTPFLIFFACIIPYFFDSIISFISNILFLIKNRSKGATFKDAVLATKNIFHQSFYTFGFLPYEAYLLFDAIFRTLYRLWISKSKLLEWKTAQEASIDSKNGYRYYIKKMWIAPTLSFVMVLINIVFIDYLGFFSFTVLCTWAASPIIANYISQRINANKHKISDSDKHQFNILAKRTFHYFYAYCLYENYYFAPDNVQEYPFKLPVNRTSPTNIGFSLSAFYTGYVFGFIPYFHMVDKIKRIVEGIEVAEKHEGHLFNWYDIQNLSPLNPKYISSVDSGNLACYIVLIIKALDQSLEEKFYYSAINGLYYSLLDELKKSDKKIIKLFEAKLNKDISIFELWMTLNQLLEHLSRNSHKSKGSVILPLIESYISEIESYFPYVKTLEKFKDIGPNRENINIIKKKLSVSTFNELITAQKIQITELEKHISVSKYDSNNETLLKAICSSNSLLISKRSEIITLRNKMADILYAMDFSKLYDFKRDLFYIGYDFSNQKMSESHYDLLASEARQTALIAIAKGDVPTKHWFRLSRPVTISQERRILLSWSGTMFEYLMPLLLMKNYEATLLNETYNGVVDTQITYGKKKSTPWGISESGYYDFDFDMFYQYKAFGVPRLSLKFADEDNVVITPYATILSLSIRPA